MGSCLAAAPEPGTSMTMWQGGGERDAFFVGVAGTAAGTAAAAAAATTMPPLWLAAAARRGSGFG
jgi:hypothetical protein